MTFSKFQHSIAMVKLKNVEKWYILQCFQAVINFLMHNTGLMTLRQDKFFIYGIHLWVREETLVRISKMDVGRMVLHLYVFIKQYFVYNSIAGLI